MDSPLVGRDAERSRLRAALAAARSGAGGMVVLSGEAGAGKTRLADDLADVGSAAGLPVLRGAAVDGAGPFRPLSGALLAHLRDRAVVETPALRPYRAALHRLAPDWPADETADPATVVDPLLVLGEGLLRLLSQLAGDTGALLVLDDLHWADPDTVAVLGYLTETVRSQRLLVVATVRTDESLPAGLSSLRRRATEIPVPALDAEAVQSLARLLLPEAADEERSRIAELSDGLPLLVQELCRWSAEGGRVTGGGRRTPHPLADLVAERMERLTEPARDVLNAAAVIGVELDWQLLPSASGRPLAEVGDVLAGLAVTFLDVDPADGRRLRWRHAALRDAVLGTLVPAQVAGIARRATSALSASDPDLHGPFAEQQVDLLVRAGEPGRAAGVLLVLAERAAARSALHTAEEQLRRSAALGGSTAAKAALVTVLDRAGRSVEAIELGERALEAPPDSAYRELCLALARAAVTAADWDRAIGYLDRLGPADAEALAVRADALFGAGDAQAARQAAAGAIALGERSGEQTAGQPGGQHGEAAAGQAWAVLGQCLAPTNQAASREAWRQAAAIGVAHRMPALRVRAAVALANGTDESRPPGTELAAVRDIAVSSGLLAQAAAVDILTADEVSTDSGPAAGLATADRAVQLCEKLHLSRLRATALSCAAGLAAELDDADRLAGIRGQLGTDGPMEVAPVLQICDGLLALHRNDLSTAFRRLDDGTAGLVSPAAAPLKYWGLWAVLAALEGRWDDAARDRFAAGPAKMRPLNVAGTVLADAVLAGREDAAGRAAALYGTALAMIPRRRWWAAVLAHVALTGALADGWGDPAAELRRLLAVFETMQAGALARTCRDRLRTTGTAVPRRGRGAADVPPALAALGVTSRELDVLELVRTGCTNAQIAQRLYLSRRTVETHVAHLLAKTAAGSRTELPQAVERIVR